MFKLFRRRDPRIPLLENVLTPDEIAGLVAQGHYRAADFEVSRLLLTAAPKPFRREAVSPAATLYSTAVAADTLLIGFSDIAAHLMMPVSVLLQLSPETMHVLLLRDSDRNHYRRGVAGLGDNFGELVASLGAFADRGGYGRVLTFGTSIGGYAALRAGRLIGCDRAVSISGRQVWHPRRILARDRILEAFDPLCACVASRTHCVALHSRDHERDAGHASQIAAMLPGADIVTVPGKDHNIVHEMFKRDRLGALLDQLFDTGRPVDPRAIAAMMA